MGIAGWPEEGGPPQPAQHWAQAWQPLIDLVSSELDDDEVRFGPDAVEPGAIRRFLEPLEFDCLLHRDATTAQAQGWPDIIAPYTAVWSFIMPAMWQPGEPPTFDDWSRDAQPWRSPLGDDVFQGAPETSGVFGTGVTMEFMRPLHVGERAGVSGRRLLACVPKETTVGRGAFVTFERYIVVAGTLERICRVEMQMYLFNPHPATTRNDARD